MNAVPRSLVQSGAVLSRSFFPILLAVGRLTRRRFVCRARSRDAYFASFSLSVLPSRDPTAASRARLLVSVHSGQANGFNQDRKVKEPRPLLRAFGSSQLPPNAACSSRYACVSLPPCPFPNFPQTLAKPMAAKIKLRAKVRAPLLPVLHAPLTPPRSPGQRRFPRTNHRHGPVPPPERDERAFPTRGDRRS